MEAPRHRAFLIGVFLCGAAALALIPLHLALAGPIGLPLLPLLGWMLLQWPLGLYVSQSGRLDHGYLVSAMLLAAALTGVAVQTGGAGSPALVGLVTVPPLAALSNSRLGLAVGAAAAGLALALVAGFGAADTAQMGNGTKVLAVGIAVACAGLLSGVLLWDRLRLKGRISSQTLHERELETAAGDVLLKSVRGGGLTLVGGEVTRLLGRDRFSRAGDWLFPHIHLQDRSAYLTALAACHAAGTPQTLDLRLESGNRRADGQTAPDQIWVSVSMHAAADAGTPAHGAGSGASVLIKLTDITVQKREDLCRQGAMEAEKADLAARLDFLRAAGPELAGPVRDILTLSDLLAGVPMAPGRESPHVRTMSAQLHCAGTRLQLAVKGMQASLDLEAGARPLQVEALSLDAALDRAVREAASLASVSGMEIRLRKGADLPSIPADKDLLDQMLLHMLVTVAGAGEPGQVVVVDVSRNVSAVAVEAGLGEGPDAPRPASVPGHAVSIFRRDLMRRLAAALNATCEIDPDHARGARIRLALPCPQARLAPNQVGIASEPVDLEHGIPLRKSA